LPDRAFGDTHDGNKRFPRARRALRANQGWIKARGFVGAGHILTFVKHLEGGGVERALLRLARGWLASGRRVTLVAGRLAGPLVAELPPGIETVVPETAGLLALPRVVRSARPDLIFCAGNTYTSTAAWTRAMLDGASPPIVAKMSNTSDRPDLGAVGRAANRLWLRTHGQFLDHLVAMTPDTAVLAERALAMPGRVSVIPNPPAELIPGAPVPSLPNGRFILGVGRLVAQKRWDRLIAALPSLADPQVSLVIVGEGERRAALEAQVAALGLQHRVSLPGHSADPLPAMARAAVLALPSDFEGVPGVLRESLSVGTPVVATDSSAAVAEIVTGRELGTVVAGDDDAGLVAALDHWVSPHALRPAPVPQPGHDSTHRYLSLFDRLVEARALSRAGSSPAPPAAPIAAPARP
jgi:glycosyltransferase involved in cell wall biosynthesis